MGRAPCCDKANVKKGPWSPEEDAKLKNYIDEYGTGNNWIALPHKIGLKRCGKSCRLRWLNYLRPNIKRGGFSEEEDSIICSLFVSIGSRWSIIAAQLPGRTDNDIKNYWNTRLKKKLLGRRRDLKPSQLAATNQELDNKGSKASQNYPYPNPTPCESTQKLTTSALERLQIYMHFKGLQSLFSFQNNAHVWPTNNLQTLNCFDALATTATSLKHCQQASVGSSLNEHIGLPSSSLSNNLETEFDNLHNDYMENLELTNASKGINDEMVFDWSESNGFEVKSYSCLWDSTSVLQPDSVLIQDSELGNNL